MTDATPLKVGVVGLGYAGTTHAQSYRDIPGVTVVALAGKEPDRLIELGSTLNIPVLLDDWRDLVALDELDIVSVATPNALHAPITIAALEAGKHVFCEKPLAIGAARGPRDGRSGARSRPSARGCLQPPAPQPTCSTSRATSRRPESARSTTCAQRWKRRSGIPGLNSWFTSKSLAGGGALIDLGPHVLDIVLFLLGEPRVTTVSAVTHGALGRAGYGAMDLSGQMAGGHTGFEVEDLASALLRTDAGTSIQYEISWAGHTADDEDISIELLGVDGGARLLIKRYATDGTLTIYRDRRRRTCRHHPADSRRRQRTSDRHPRVHRHGALGRLVGSPRRRRRTPHRDHRRLLRVGATAERGVSVRVTIYNEGVHEADPHSATARLYPEGMHGAIAEGLRTHLPRARIRFASLADPLHGLSDEVLADTDVLLWWGHEAHAQVADSVVTSVIRRVHEGMGFLPLHSAHYSKPFTRLMGTTCSLRWRNDNDRELVWTVSPTHPIAAGVSEPAS